MDLFTLQNLMTLGMLILLQAVLGFDNLLYISLESKRVEENLQQRVRRMGIGIAIALRLVLLGVVQAAIGYFKDPWFQIGDEHNPYIHFEINLHAVVTIFGGAFILYTAIKEIYHLLVIDDLEGHGQTKATRSFGSALFWIVLMNLVFSFDSILSAMALTDQFLVMAAAIVVSGIAMILLADHVSEFLKRNRMYEVLGLFILFLVGIMLVTEGGHLGHVELFGYEVEAMSKSTFYFTLVVLIIVDVVQGRYQKKLLAQREAHG